GKRALARAVGAHDRVHLAGLHLEVQALEDLPAFHGSVEISDGQHGFLSVSHPTAPSSVTPSSFCASTANSIGSSRNTSLQKPFTIMFTASSSGMPRWRQ